MSEELMDGSKNPVYIQLQHLLVKIIEEGEYLPGEMMPSEREMAKKYGINRMTVKNAVNALVEKGYLYRVQGKGTFVKKKNFNKLDLGFLIESGNTGITAMVKSQGIQISNQVLGKGVIAGSDYFSDKLCLKTCDEIFGLHRVRYGNGEPLAVEYTYVPKSYFPNIEEMNFKHVSLYDYMESMGHMPYVFQQKLMIIKVSEKEAKYLEIDPKHMVYYFEFIGKDKSGNVVEYTESYIRTDKSEFRFKANVL